jgi:hypothetical protein
MIKCSVCEKLIGSTSLSYKASAGFLDSDGVFHEDSIVIIHRDCYHDYMYSPFEDIERRMKEGI